MPLHEVSPQIYRPVENGLQRADVFVGCADSDARDRVICDETFGVVEWIRRIRHRGTMPVKDLRLSRI